MNRAVAVILLASLACASSCGRRTRQGNTPPTPPPVAKPAVSPKGDDELPAVGKQLSSVEGVSIVRAEDAGGRFIKLAGNGLSAKEALATALAGAYRGELGLYDFAPLPDGLYRITVDAPREDTFAKLSLAYEKAFGVEIGEREHEVEIVVLSGKGGTPSLKSSSPDTKRGMRTVTGGYEFTGYTMDMLAGFLEERLGSQVADETGLEGRFDFKLAFSPFERTPQADGELLKKLGLTLKVETRKLKVVAVDRAGEQGLPSAGEPTQ